VPTTNSGASLEAMLITIGADQPEQEETIAEPRMNAPTRVNVANRHLGNKACFQETIVYSEKSGGFTLRSALLTALVREMWGGGTSQKAVSIPR